MGKRDCERASFGLILFEAIWKSTGLTAGRSSAIQVLPAIQPHVKNLTTFIRSPTYIAPPMGTSDQREYTEEEKQAFKNQPGALLKHRKEMEDGLNKYFGMPLPIIQTLFQIGSFPRGYRASFSL